MPKLFRSTVISLNKFLCTFLKCTLLTRTKNEARTSPPYKPVGDAYELEACTTQACTGEAHILAYSNKLIFNCTNLTCTGLDAHFSVLISRKDRALQTLPRTEAVCGGDIILGRAHQKNLFLCNNPDCSGPSAHGY